MENPDIHYSFQILLPQVYERGNGFRFEDEPLVKNLLGSAIALTHNGFCFHVYNYTNADPRSLISIVKSELGGSEDLLREANLFAAQDLLYQDRIYGHRSEISGRQFYISDTLRGGSFWKVKKTFESINPKYLLSKFASLPEMSKRISIDSDEGQYEANIQAPTFQQALKDAVAVWNLNNDLRG